MSALRTSGTLVGFSTAVVGTVALSVLLHLSLGWQWTPIAALPAGVFRARGSLAAGAIGVGGGWLLLVVYSVIVASRPTLRMLALVGSLFGNLPAPAVVAITALIGGVLGLLGAWVGRRAALLRSRRKEHPA